MAKVSHSKRALYVAALFAASTVAITVHAQNKSLGVGTPTPNVNASLHVESPTNNQGFIMPRLTTAQRSAMTPNLSVTDKGLLLFDTDLDEVYVWDGLNWGSTDDFNLPATKVLSNDDMLNDFVALDIRYTGDSSRTLLNIDFDNASNPIVTNPARITHRGQGAALNVSQTGTLGTGGIFQITNPLNPQAAVRGLQSGTGAAIDGVHNGTSGHGGLFSINNPSNDSPALMASTAGNGAAIFAETSTGFSSLHARRPGASNGNAAVIEVTDAGNNFSALQVNTQGTGAAANINIGNIVNSAPALFAYTNGTGTSITGRTTTGWTSVEGVAEGIGHAGFFNVENASSSAASLQVGTVGLGSGANVNIDNPASTAAAVMGTSNGAGAAISANMTGTGTAVSGFNNGPGGAFSPAAHFQIMGVTNGSAAIQVQTLGTGHAANLAIQNSGNSSPALNVTTDGTGSGISSSTSTGYTAIVGQHNGPSDGFGGLFEVTNAGNTYQAIKATTLGTGGAALFEVLNNTTTGPALQTNSNAPGGAIRGSSTGTGYAGYFDVNNSSSGAAALNVVTNGTGQAFLANHQGASGNIALFQNSNSNVARIDKSGQGFFNGGTVSSGADVAEMFEVEGSRDSYEPGDVLVISIDTDRTVEKSSEAISTKVAGVYATKPGVILTEKGIDEKIDDLVPMGVVGVIPTKVCLQNGPIKRGDLLVTSSKQGHAMKAIPVVINGLEIYPTGAILGKALENFETSATGSGLIKVLVNVK